MAGFLKRALRNSHARLAGALGKLIGSGRPSERDLESLEEALIRADIGPETADALVQELRSTRGDEAPRDRLARRMTEILRDASPAPTEQPVQGPQVWMLVGVNGSGKTTTAAKLAHRLRAEGKSVILGAADTFRAAAVEQLRTWGDRLGVQVISHQAGGDPAAVVFDTCQAAAARGLDVAIIDTAGRLHTKSNLMAEIDKVRRVAGKVVPGAPHEVLLVLDGTTGQNGLRQAEEFLRHAGVTGLVLAKLDGTARGGVALTIAERMHLPIRYAGTGEGIEDLEPFEPEAYVEALLGEGAA